MDRLREIQARDDVRTEALRAAAGILLGLAAYLALIRKTATFEPWGDFAILLLLLVPAIVLYGGGMVAAREAVRPKAWHAVWVVIGIFFIFGSTQQFLEWVDGDTGASLNVAWTTTLTAASGIAAALFARVRFGWLIAGIALSIAWLALWDAIISDGLGSDIGTFRGVCMVGTALLAAGAVAGFRAGRMTLEEGSEVLTAAGVLFVTGAGLVSLSLLFGGAIAFAVDGASDVGGEPSTFWDTVLLIGSIALIGAGSYRSVRGPVYVGGIGLFIFGALAGSDLDNPMGPDGSLQGWPLLLLAIAIVALVASALSFNSDSGDSVPSAPQQEPPPPASPPPSA